MNIVQLTPGAGGMYCGNCLRDNALVAELRKSGHFVLMLPLYLPMTLDEEDQSTGMPIFFSGINVYLEQKSAFFRGAPDWLHKLLASPALLKLAAGSAAKTRAGELGDLTLSMLRGEEGHQTRELNELIAWLKTQPRPDVICLSNALLAGLARRLKSELAAPVVCMLQGEDYYLDSLPESHRAACWKTLSERAAEIDLFIAPSRYFGELMAERLGLLANKLHVVHNGIHLDGYGTLPHPEVRAGDSGAPVLGYFARMCKEKGLDILVEAYLLLRRQNRVKNLKLRIGGGCGPADEPFVSGLRERLHESGFAEDVEFHPNLDRKAKLGFLRTLTVFSVPASYSEAFGLYVIEALASGVPVVEPRCSAFPELIEATGGGLLCEPGDPAALADALEQLLTDPEKLRRFGEDGRKAVFERFNAGLMAQRFAEVYMALLSSSARETKSLPGTM